MTVAARRPRKTDAPDLQVAAGQVYQSQRGHRIRVTMVRRGSGDLRGPYAWAIEVTRNGKPARGFRDGIDRSLPIRVALRCDIERGWVMPPGYTEVS